MKSPAEIAEDLAYYVTGSKIDNAVLTLMFESIIYDALEEQKQHICDIADVSIECPKFSQLVKSRITYTVDPLNKDQLLAKLLLEKKLLEKKIKEFDIKMNLEELRGRLSFEKAAGKILTTMESLLLDLLTDQMDKNVEGPSPLPDDIRKLVQEVLHSKESKK